MAPILRRLSAMHTSLNSARVFCNPRMLNCLNPKTLLIQPLVSVVNEFAGLIFTIGDGRDGRAGASTSANGAGISTGAVGF